MSSGNDHEEISDRSPCTVVPSLGDGDDEPERCEVVRRVLQQMLQMKPSRFEAFGFRALILIACLVTTRRIPAVRGKPSYRTDWTLDFGP